MKKISSWMSVGCKRGALLFLSLGMCSAVFSAQTHDPVNDFARDMDFCYYMVATPGGVQDELENRYSIALQKALNYLQRNNQGMTMLEAILVVRSECKARISEVTRARTP